MMTRDSGGQERLAVDIRRQIGSEATKRFLRLLPAFRTEADMPEQFTVLLDRLDHVEYGPANGRKT